MRGNLDMYRRCCSGRVRCSHNCHLHRHSGRNFRNVFLRHHQDCPQACHRNCCTCMGCTSNKGIPLNVHHRRVCDCMKHIGSRLCLLPQRSGHNSHTLASPYTAHSVELRHTPHHRSPDDCKCCKSSGFRFRPSFEYGLRMFCKLGSESLCGSGSC